MNTTTREPGKERSMNSNDGNDAMTTQSPPRAANHHAPQEAPKRDGERKVAPSADPNLPKTRLRMVLLVVTLVVVVAAGTCYFRFIAPYESTDDAFIEAHVTPVAPQVAGRVAQLFVQDNQEV